MMYGVTSGKIQVKINIIKNVLDKKRKERSHYNSTNRVFRVKAKRIIDLKNKCLKVILCDVVSFIFGQLIVARTKDFMELTQLSL